MFVSVEIVTDLKEIDMGWQTVMDTGCLPPVFTRVQSRKEKPLEN